MRRFFNWVKAGFSGEYMQRQMYVMGNLGLFWMILLAMFAVPLLGTFVVVLIKGVIDLRYLVLAVGIVGFSLLIYFTGKTLYRLIKQIRQDGLFSFRDAQRRARTGEKVQLTFLGGLISLSMGATGHDAPMLPSGTAPLSLPDSPGHTVSPDPIRQLQDLQALLQDGVVDSVEFEALKKSIIRKATAAPRPERPEPLRESGTADEWEFGKKDLH